MNNPATSIRIGTMINSTGGAAAARIGEIAHLGFESFEPFFWQTTNGHSLSEMGKKCLDAIGSRDITLAIFFNHFPIFFFFCIGPHSLR